MNTFLPANMLTNKDKVISLRDDTVKVSDENADRTTMVRPPSSSYSARVKVHIKPLGIKFVEKIDSSACPTIRDFVERQLWKVQEIRGKEIRVYVEEFGNEEEGYELFGDTETCVLKPDELLTVKLVSDDTKKQKKVKTVERTRKTKKVTSTTRMVDFYEEGKKKRKKGEEENAEKDSSSEDEDGENESKEKASMGLCFRKAVTLDDFLDGYNTQVNLPPKRVLALTKAEKSKRSSYINYWKPFARIFSDALSDFETLFGDKAGEYIGEFELAMEEALVISAEQASMRAGEQKRWKPVASAFISASAETRETMRTSWNLKGIMNQMHNQIVHSAIVRAGAKGIHAKDILSEREKVKLNTVRAVQLKGMQQGIYKRVSPGTYAITSKGSEKVIKKMKNSPNSVLTISTPTNAKNFTTIKSPLTTQRKLLTTDDISSRLTGKMISVKFEDPPEWFVATVLSFDVIEQKSSLFYQDGDRELLNMAKACRKGQLSWVVHGDNGTSKTHYRLPPPSPITDSEKAQRALERLRSYIKSLNGTLPEGWNDVDIHYYRNGVSENYFISPEGKKYKGPRAVAKALNLL